MSVLDDVIDAYRASLALRPDPIAPENRRVARLFPSVFVQRGSVFRLAPQPDIVGHSFPLIVMNRDDVDILRSELAKTSFGLHQMNIDQEIADCCEQLFAEREAKGL